MTDVLVHPQYSPPVKESMLLKCLQEMSQIGYGRITQELKIAVKKILGGGFLQCMCSQGSNSAAIHWRVGCQGHAWAGQPLGR